MSYKVNGKRFRRRYFWVICNGCSAEFTGTLRGLWLAMQHDQSDVCNKRGDREADSWRLDFDRYSDAP